MTAPYWVKLTRSGATVSAYQSADGASWSLVGTATVTLPATALVGLAGLEPFDDDAGDGNLQPGHGIRPPCPRRG